jgi:hypothetical protein
VLVGSEMNVSINARHSLLFEFAKAAVHQNSPAVVGFSVKYDYVWWRLVRTVRGGNRRVDAES